MRYTICWIGLLSCLSLVGCQSTNKHKTIVPVGSDTYRVSRTSEFGPAITKQQAYRNATEFANSQGKAWVAIDENVTKEGDFHSQEMHTYTLTFKLVEVDALETTTNGDVKHGGGASTGPKDTFTQLKELKQMLDEGLLTDEEFETVKKEILSQ